MASTIDRRRNNGPANSAPPIFETASPALDVMSVDKAEGEEEKGKFFLKTGLVHKSNGSTYYEKDRFKVMVSVQGPRPLSKSTPYSPSASIVVEFKYAPFALSGVRYGYVKTPEERVIGQLIEDAVAPSVLGARYPKCEISIIVMVLERADDGDGGGESETIAGCVTATSAALADAGIEVCDLVSGVAVPCDDEGDGSIVLGYMPNREEVTMLYSTLKAGTKQQIERLVEKAVHRAKNVNLAVSKSLLESV